MNNAILKINDQYNLGFDKYKEPIVAISLVISFAFLGLAMLDYFEIIQ